MQDSAWKDVTHNFLYFVYELLPGASSRATWTKDGVDRALSWSAYCERTIGRLRHRGSLQVALSKVVRQSWQAVTLLDLRSAQRLLLGLLLQNQLLEESVREHVKQTALSILGPDVTASLIESAVQQQQYSKILFRDLTKSKYEDVHSSLRMRLMLEAANSSGPEQVGECLSKVIHSPAGIHMVWEAVMLEGEESVSHSVRVGPRVVEWMEGILSAPHHQQYRRVCSKLYSLPPDLLTEVLFRYPKLLHLVLECLKREAENMEPLYASSGCCWTPRGSSLLGWEGLVGTYAALVGHEGLAGSVQKAVDSWSLEEGGVVWEEVVKQARTPSTHLHPQTSSDLQ